jgi:N-acetylneuraminate 9-O-acetyltransferase
MRRLPNVLGAAAALVGAVLYVLLLQWIGDMCNSGIELSAAQLGAAFAYGVALSVWIAAEVGFVTARNMSSGLAPAFELEPADNEETQKLDGTQLPEVHVLFGALRADMLPQLRAAAEFSLIMGYVFVCDRTTFFAAGPKDVSSLKFWGLWALITMVALVSIRPVHKSLTKPLQRDQTEEWKGWMQLMFILYHYFEQKELYNAIRVYIACYVWMTGFGNFSYYYVKADFTLARFAQMMWRLNFFVFFVCVTMDNEYMLYYICPMHTFFTWTVFIPLWIGHKHNKRNRARIRTRAPVVWLPSTQPVPPFSHFCPSPHFYPHACSTSQ